MRSADVYIVDLGGGGVSEPTADARQRSFALVGT